MNTVPSDQIFHTKCVLQWEHWLLVSETIMVNDKYEVWLIIQLPHIWHTTKSAVLVNVVTNVRYASNGLCDHLIFIEHV